MFKNPQYKILSFSTTMRNPKRIASFLKILLPFENQILDEKIIMQVVRNLIKNRLYVPNFAYRNFKEKLQNEENFSDDEIDKIIENSPQNHKEAGFKKGWESRFDTWYKLMMEFGFCFYAKNKKIILSNCAKMLIEATNQNTTNEQIINDIFLNCMAKYNLKNPFRKILNANSPLILLLQVMQNLKEKCGDSKISKQEISFFLCWKDNNFKTLSDYILNFREKFKSFNYSNDIIYQKCLEILETNNQNRFKKSQICGETIDEYIRKMRITGIISLRGNGRFLDLNSYKMQKIEYILKKYSNIKFFDDKQKYFDFMGEFDEKILEFKDKINEKIKDNLKIKTLQKFANNYNKNQILNELKILANNKISSKDEIFKFIPEPTRFEFLTAIALKQNFISLKVLPNYIIDDEGLPISYASGNTPDIICENETIKSIVEVSLICGKSQLLNELLPISRHLKDLKADKKQKFAIFIAPKIFDDSKRYVKFIDFDENLVIKNYEILEFIKFLQNNDNFLKI